MGPPLSLSSEGFASPTEQTALVHKPLDASVEDGPSTAALQIDGLSRVVARPGQFRVACFVSVDYEYSTDSRSHCSASIIMQPRRLASLARFQLLSTP